MWIPARREMIETGTTTHELACVWKITNEGIEVFACFDGVHYIAEEVFPLTPELNDLLAATQGFSQFKLEAVRGGETVRFALGKSHLMICIGQLGEPQMKLPKITDIGERVTPTDTQPGAPVATSAERDMLDAREEVGNLLGLPPQQSMDIIVEDLPEQPAGGGLMGVAVFAGCAYAALNFLEI